MARVPTGEGAVAPLAATSAPSSGGTLEPGNTAQADTAADSAGSSAVANANGGAATGSALNNGEVTTTMQARAVGADSANSDHIITSAVQSQIAADAAGSQLAVSTINGVVILTGSVPTADAVEHVKQVAQQVKDVKGVDATAVRVSGS